MAYTAITVDSEPDKRQNALKIAFQRCRTDLEKSGFIAMHGDYVWKIDRAKQTVQTVQNGTNVPPVPTV